MAGALRFRDPSQGGRISNPGRDSAGVLAGLRSEMPRDVPELQGLIATIAGPACLLSVY